MRNILFLIIAAAAFASQARLDERSWLVGYAKGTSSYIPDKRIVREGGYEGLTSQHAYFLPAPFTENIDSEIKQIVTRAINAVK